MESRRGAAVRDGQSLVEIIVAIGIAAILAGSIVGALILSVRINKQSVHSDAASSLGQELLDKTRSLSEGSWLDLYTLDTKDASSTYILFNEDTIVATDALSAAGTFSSLDIDSSDNPVIAYYAATNNLKVLHCNDGSCIGDDESIEIVDSGGFYNSLQLDSSGYPVIAHYHDTDDDFKIVHCNDINCAGGSESTVNIDTRVSGLSLELDGSGYPVVSYQRDVGHNLKVLHCTDANCSGAKSIETADGSGSAGDYTSLALSPSTGYPVIAYPDNGKLGVMHCNDANCAGGDESQNKVDTSVSGAAFVSITLDVNGYPAVSYYDGSPRYDLKILRCNDVSCLGGDESIVTVDDVGTAGQSTSIQLDSFGNPVVSYIANDKLKILHCNDINCSGGDESIIAVDDANPQANISGTSLQLDSLGNPVVSYYDDLNDDLKVLHCDDPNCDSNVFTALAIASGTDDIIVDGVTYTRWFSVENVNRDVNGDITEPGGTEDPSTQKITVHVEWQELGDTASVVLTEYFTRWVRNETTVFTDWSGSSGAEGPINSPDSGYSTSTDIDVSTNGEFQLN